MKKQEIGKLLDNSFSAKDWDDYRWQQAHLVKDIQTLRSVIGEEAITALNAGGEVMAAFAMSITPHYLSLFDTDNIANCPIARQAVATSMELIQSKSEMIDPLGEEGFEAGTRSVVHRYPDRCLFLVANQCSMYCRFCTRKRIVGDSKKAIKPNDIEAGLEYIRKTKSIRDVLLSGGDPLFMSTKRIDYILGELRKIEHVEFIRIGTKIPCVMPQRINSELTEVLAKYAPIWINVHFNHPSELGEAAKKSLMMLLRAGCPLNNQSVLLRGINDDIDTFRRLNQKLLTCGVRPYYLYQGDLVVGTSHLRATISEGMKLIEGMTGYTTGLARPTFVVDSPRGTGKIPVMPNHLVSMDNGRTVLRDYLGGNVVYEDMVRQDQVSEVTIRRDSVYEESEECSPLPVS